MILISACLLGIYSKYDGGSNLQPLLAKYADRGKYLPVCPEQLGGLGTPRPPAEIVGGDGEAVLAGRAEVVDKAGDNQTTAFIRGARELAAIAGAFPITAAILKERSPSCGVNRIYDGSFGHIVRSGRGVAAATLCQLDIPLYSEEDINERLLIELLGRP